MAGRRYFLPGRVPAAEPRKSQSLWCGPKAGGPRLQRGRPALGQDLFLWADEALLCRRLSGWPESGVLPPGLVAQCPVSSHCLLRGWGPALCCPPRPWAVLLGGAVQRLHTHRLTLQASPLCEVPLAGPACLAALIPLCRLPSLPAGPLLSPSISISRGSHSTP